MKMDQTECSETLTYNLQTPVNYSYLEESIDFFLVPIRQLGVCSIFHQADPSLLDYPNNILRRIFYKL
jgi:hypothetical protein